MWGTDAFLFKVMEMEFKCVECVTRERMVITKTVPFEEMCSLAKMVICSSMNDAFIAIDHKACSWLLVVDNI